MGVVGFTDWAEPNATNFYCYRVLSQGLNSTEKIPLPKNVLPQNDSDQRDSTLNAIYFAAIDLKFSWPKGPSNRKYIIFFSNNKWKWAEDDIQDRGPEYKLRPPDGEREEETYDGKFCKEQAPVSKKVLFSTLENNNIHLIGFLSWETYSIYKDFFDDAPSPGNYFMIRTFGLDNDTASRVKDDIVSEIKGKICTCRIRYEFALLMDTTQTFTRMWISLQIIFTILVP